MVTISIAMITFHGECYNLVNCLNSLHHLHPEELCVVDTSSAELDLRHRFYTWLVDQAAMLGLPLKLGYRKWDGNYRDSRNQALRMCTQDWTLSIDSDEMLTLEMARDLRDYLEQLPNHVLAVRPRRVDLLDDNHCDAATLWPPYRPGLGAHARIYRTGLGHYAGGKREEVYIYPGRREIPFDSPKHPKVDWRPYYWLHLWLYKDHILRRKLHPAVMLNHLPVGLSPEELWPLAQSIHAKHTRRRIVELPSDVGTWVPIVWQLDPSSWLIEQQGDHYVYRAQYEQAGR